MTKPSLRDRLRPLELLGLSGGVALFIGVVVAATTRDIALGAIFLGVAFIASLVLLATLAITGRPDDAERHDLDDQDRLGH